MKKSLVLAMAMALGVTASAYAANPFSDVPAGHWAYDSISKLAAAGVIEGYGDTTFGGDKLMTRYEMAQIVAKAMAKGANVDKLAAEFADELDNLGVRVANLEKKADNVKITGAVTAAYASYDDTNYAGTGSYDNAAKEGNSNHRARMRTDITIKGAVNEDWSYTALLRNEQYFSNEKENSGDEGVAFQRAYLNGKVGGVKVQAGRYNFKDFTGGNIWNTRVDGVEASYGKDIKLTAGIAKGNDSASGQKADDMVYANVATKLGVVAANVGYYSFKDIGLDEVAKEATGEKVADSKIWTVGLAMDVAKDLNLSATYLRSDVDELGEVKDIDQDGYVINLGYKGAKAAVPGSWGAYVRYYDQGAGTVIAHEMDGNYDVNGFKGFRVGAAYAVAKNIVASVDYYDLESKVGEEASMKTLWSQVQFTF